MIFGQTAGSLFSEIKRKVTSWDRNAQFDPSLTQRVPGGMEGDGPSEVTAHLPYIEGGFTISEEDAD